MKPSTLIRRCIERDPAAWTELVARHRPVVVRVLIRSLNREAAGTAEDLEQELWSRLLANDCQALRGLVDATEASVRAFLARTALNLARDHFRRSSVRQVVQASPLEELVQAPDGAESIDRAFERRERQQAIFDALEKVITPPNVERDRLIFHAHYVDGYSASEISAMQVGLNPKGVESTLFRLVQRIRKQLASKEDAA